MNNTSNYNKVKFDHDRPANQARDQISLMRRLRRTKRRLFLAAVGAEIPHHAVIASTKEARKNYKVTSFDPNSATFNKAEDSNGRATTLSRQAQRPPRRGKSSLHRRKTMPLGRMHKSRSVDSLHNLHSPTRTQ